MVLIPTAGGAPPLLKQLRHARSAATRQIGDGHGTAEQSHARKFFCDAKKFTTAPIDKWQAMWYNRRSCNSEVWVWQAKPAAGRRLVGVLRHPKPQRRLFLVAINRTRNKAVTLRMTADELALFQSQFQKSGAKNQSDFLLALLKDKPIVVVDKLVPTLAELRRQGNNLNQIARALHDGSAIEQGAQQILRECHALYKKLLALQLGE